MSRAAYDRILAVYYGVDGADPGAFKGTILGRFVPDPKPFSVDYPMTNIVGYVTSDSDWLTAGNAFTDSGTIFWQLTSADRIEIPEISDVPLALYMRKYVTGEDIVPYYRYWIGFIA